MVKKVKRNGKGGLKEKRNPVASPNLVSQQDTQKVNTPEDGVTAVNDKKICDHIDKSIDVEKVTAKLGSSGPVRCEDCREGAVNRRARKGKGKHGKKKGGGESKSDSKAIWICLECGHFLCGGVGFPATPQSHAVRHARLYRHSLAVQFENPQLRWCFPCNRLIPAEKIEESTEQKYVLQDIVKMIKGRSTEEPSLDVDDVWFGTGNITSGIKSEASVEIGAYGKSGYVVRGLLNLGNTCFFNSIIQNLLAMYRLRDYFLEMDDCAGPLTTSFTKLFTETSPEDTLRNAINPKSFFGSLCAKAPQFRGYQQHDSHELLHCLLDGLCTEELTARKKLKSSQDDGKSPPTFVDAIFGGRLSSTVTCLECGHSSLVYEPFLDLSLPVPTKKPPPKKTQPVSRAKKSKHPPKRSGRVRPKVSRDAASFNAQSAQESTSMQSSAPITEGTTVPSDGALLDCVDASDVADNMGLTSHNLSSSLKSNNETASFNAQSAQESTSMQSSAPITEGTTVPSDGALLDCVDASDVADNMGLTSHNLSSSLKSNNEKNVDGESTSMDNFTWLDYLDQDSPPNGNDIVSQLTSPDLSSSQNGITGQLNSVENFTCSTNLDHDILPKGDDITSQNDDILTNQGCGEEACSPDDSICLDDQGQSKSPNCNIASQFCEEAPVKDCYASEVACNSAPNSQFFSADSNLGNDSSTRIWEDEAPLQVQDSEILLLPYKEETSATSDVPKAEGKVSYDAVVGEQDFTCFDGFGGLFNEPEPVAGPAEKPSKSNGIGEASSAVGNSTESDPDEIDNTDAPVSVESCLACFTKPELLSKIEHAWQCENCAKLLREQTMRLSKKLPKPRSGDLENAPEDSNQRDIELRTTNGSAVKGDDGLVYQNRTNGSSQDEACSVVNCDNRGKLDEPESEESENETDSKGVKVERDATKRILIDKVPPILTVHLKRFSQDARGRLSKLSGHVNFRDTIDITTFIDPRCLQKEVYKYRLVGVVEHSGTMRGGHYVAYVRGGPKVVGKNKDAEDHVWYYASDAYVREVSLEEVLRSEAYILFYEEM